MNTPIDQPNEADDQDDDWFEWAGPSKSQQKRDAHRLQNLGIELLNLSPENLASIPLTSALEDAFTQVRSIKKREALRRHHQLIGKLMRSADAEAIVEALDKIKEVNDRINRMSHAMEQWRDNLIQGDQGYLEQFIQQYPNADRQQLRQLVRSTKKELSQKKPPANARKLFRFIREVMTEGSE